MTTKRYPHHMLDLATTIDVATTRKGFA